MNLCGDGHEEVCYEGTSCPVCTIQADGPSALVRGVIRRREMEKEFVETVKKGAVRKPIQGRYDLISPIGLMRLARIYEEGGKEYGDHNWEKGLPASNALNHAIRHLQLYLAGDRSEDHMAKVAWGCFAVMHMEFTHPEVIDVSMPQVAKSVEEWIDGYGKK